MRFTVQKLAQRAREMADYVYSERIALGEWRVRRAPVADGALPQLDDSEWDVYHVGHALDGPEASYWFRRWVEIPASLAGRPVCLYMAFVDQDTLLGEEGLVYANGRLLQALSTNHHEVLLADSARAGDRYLVAVDAFTGMRRESIVLRQADLVAVERETRDYYFNTLVALQVAETLPAESYDRVRILNVLDETDLLVDWRRPKSAAFYDSVRAANAALKSSLYSSPTPGEREKVTLVGHSHIDVAWLWTLAVTRQKCGRTFSTVLSLMDQYPEYRFTQSQPQLYEYTRTDFPQIYEQIKRQVKEGRWEPTGGMWVEADCNVTSGESLVRQLLFGKRFFQKEFGVDCQTLWLPDAFGYNWALPQLMRGAGMRYFMTTKISWNQYDQLPYDTFWWQGIDGTKVLTHFVTTPSGHWFKTYNGEIAPKNVKGCWDSYQQKDVNDEVLFSFGWGDGGGGPTIEMLETARRLADFPGAPRCTMGSAEDYFKRLEARLESKRVPVWNGELYLEYHRGTYTTQGHNKRANRKSEVLYHAAELFGSAASLLGTPYPRQALNEGWKLILLNQFHDIIPGSSITEVYRDSAADYHRVTAIGQEALGSALATIAGQIDLPGDDPAIVVFNPTSWERTDIVLVRLPEGKTDFGLVDQSGHDVPHQIVRAEDGSTCAIFEATVPPCGYATHRVKRPGATQTAPVDATTLSTDGRVLENQYFRATFDGQAQLISIFDKRAQREVLPEGQQGNVLQAFEDKPLANDAWDIDLYYQDKMWQAGGEVDMAIIERGPVRAGIQITRRFSQSSLVQRIYVYARTPRIDFATEVDWHEKHTLLKAAFPVNIRATQATYEIQFGNVERPVHWNTSWDWARFEACAQKWVDLSEGDYGVSLLNDCKYGHDVKDNVIRLSLLRSPVSPDPVADEGQHRFVYSLYPHAGTWRNGTIREAYGLNYPLLGRWEAPHPGSLPQSDSLVQCDRSDVVVETVKLAEDGDDLVVRVYEAQNQRGMATLKFARPIASAVECNLLEQESKRVIYSGRELRFSIKPYEIKTFRIAL